MEKSVFLWLGLKMEELETLEILMVKAFSISSRKIGPQNDFEFHM